MDPPASRNYFLPVAATMVVVAVLDQVVKQIMLTWLEPGQPVAVIGDWFRFYLLFNPGAAFSMGQNFTWVFTGIQFVFVVGALIVNIAIYWYSQASQSGVQPGSPTKSSAHTRVAAASQQLPVVGDGGVRTRRAARHRIGIGLVGMDALAMIAVLAAVLLGVGRHHRAQGRAAGEGHQR